MTPTLGEAALAVDAVGELGTEDRLGEELV